MIDLIANMSLGFKFEIASVKKKSIPNVDNPLLVVAGAEPTLSLAEKDFGKTWAGKVSHEVGDFYANVDVGLKETAASARKISTRLWAIVMA